MNLHTGYKVVFATDLSVLRDSLLFEFQECHLDPKLTNDGVEDFVTHCCLVGVFFHELLDLGNVGFDSFVLFPNLL